MPNEIDDLAMDLTNEINSLGGDIEDLRQTVDALGTNLERLTDSVQLLTWAVCEAGQLWLPISLTTNAPDVTPSQAAKVLSDRALELARERRDRGPLAKMMEDSK